MLEIAVGTLSSTSDDFRRLSPTRFALPDATKLDSFACRVVVWIDELYVYSIGGGVQMRPTCCPRGPKLIQDVIVCDAPCCPDLREMKTSSMPHMGEFVWCDNSAQVRPALCPIPANTYGDSAVILFHIYAS